MIIMVENLPSVWTLRIYWKNFELGFFYDNHCFVWRLFLLLYFYGEEYEGRGNCFVLFSYFIGTLLAFDKKIK